MGRGRTVIAGDNVQNARVLIAQFNRTPPKPPEPFQTYNTNKTFPKTVDFVLSFVLFMRFLFEFHAWVCFKLTLLYQYARDQLHAEYKYEMSNALYCTDFEFTFQTTSVNSNNKMQTEAKTESLDVVFV